MGAVAMSKVTSRSEADRLGKRGSYRLGGFGLPGPGKPDPPPAFRPSLAAPQHRSSALAGLLAALLGILLTAAGAMLRPWFMPFPLCLAAGSSTSPGRLSLP